MHPTAHPTAASVTINLSPLNRGRLAPVSLPIPTHTPTPTPIPTGGEYMHIPQTLINQLSPPLKPVIQSWMCNRKHRRAKSVTNATARKQAINEHIANGAREQNALIARCSTPNTPSRKAMHNSHITTWVSIHTLC